MKLISIPPAGPSKEHHFVLVFGAGLVGSAIISHLNFKASLSCEDVAWSWHDAAQRTAMAETLVGRLAPHAGSGILSLVWAAGAGGFNSPDEVLDCEFSAFSDAMDLACRVAAAGDWIGTNVHLVSSAGGLFEGLRFVGRESEPTGNRGYALSKLRQEAHAESVIPAKMGLHVYRPSSVYGYHRGGRINLVSALVRNGYRHKTTTIFGRTSTLRDFIHSADVGRQIGDGVLAAAPGRSCEIVASGKPTAMSEVIHTVESVIGQKLLLQFDTTPTNAGDNSFRPVLTGPSAARIPLRVGIERTAEAWKRAEFLSPAR